MRCYPIDLQRLSKILNTLSANIAGGEIEFRQCLERITWLNTDTGHT